MAGFELSKWYADCTTEAGDALILYSAELRWRGSTIHYTNLLMHRPGRAPQSRFSLRNQPPPKSSDGVVQWASSQWHFTGYWRESGSGYRETLFESPEGCLEWNCVAPRSAARVLLASTDELRGWGYVEHLRLTLPPWRLPIRRLRWGRFVTAADTLVWIDWSGPYRRRVVFHNGAAVDAQTISDREVAWHDGASALNLEPVTALREGPLGSTALAVLPNLNRLFPRSILSVREQKWLSRAVLRRRGQLESAGMAIHEVVEWP